MSATLENVRILDSWFEGRFPHVAAPMYRGEMMRELGGGGVGGGVGGGWGGGVCGGCNHLLL